MTESTAAASRPPVALHDVIGQIRISPDGSSFVTTTGRYGREAIVIMDRDDLEATGAVRAQPGNEIRDVRWVSPTRIPGRKTLRVHTPGASLEGRAPVKSLTAERDGFSLNGSVACKAANAESWSACVGMWRARPLRWSA